MIFLGKTIKHKLLFLLAAATTLAAAQENDTNYIIDIISTREGLSHNYASSIVSDSLNVKWIGTENGITKFDGLNFEYIKPTGTYKDLKNENIEVLFRENANHIWVGTKSGGLSCINIKQNSITNYDFLINSTDKSNLSIVSLTQDKNKNIWAGTLNEGIFVIDYINKKLVNHINLKTAVLSIIKDPFDNVWYASDNYVYKYDASENRTIKFNLDYLVTDLAFDDARDRIWIGTAKSNGELFYLNLNTQKIESVKTQIKSNYGILFSLDHLDRLWVGTWRHGLYRSNKNLTQFSEIELVPSRSDKIKANYNTIIDIHHDQNNMTWIATTNGGVVKLVEPKGFFNLDAFIQPEQLNGDLNIECIYRNQNAIFLGTCKKGAFFGNDFNTLTPINGIGHEKVFAFLEHQNQLLIGATSGLYVFDLNLKKIVSEHTWLRKVTAILVDHDSNLYIGTQHDGIAIVPLNEISNRAAYKSYSTNANNNTPKIKSDRITSIAEDTNGNVWFGTYNGIHRYDTASQKFYHQSELLEEELPSVIINELKIKNNTIWAATPGGLFKLIYTNKKLTVASSLTKENGLKSDFICALDFDAQDNLWLSANTEIVKYNEKNGTFSSYETIDGVATTSFNNRSVFNYRNNTIYFGGVDNITFFNPNIVTSFKSSPQIILTNLRVNNKNIDFKNSGEGESIIEENFSYVNHLTFDHKDKLFSMDIVPNDFLGNENISYRYKLLGNQDDWINIKNRNELNFTGLSAGKYTLKVAATRDNQNWVEAKNINITVKNSPWKSPWAFFLYAFILSAILYSIIKTYNNQIRLKNKLQLARIDREKEIRLSEAKLTFFTNISHEFRTPLTLIVSPLAELLENTHLPAKVSEKLRIIDKNTNRLLNLVNQLLDFRKADYGLLKLSAAQGNFARFSSEVFLYFKEAAKAKKIQYTFTCNTDEIMFPFDRNKMEIVLCNLLSNAIKYCNHGDSIHFNLSEDAETNTCLISIKDTGPGIAEENLNKIFDRFYQIKTAKTAKMIGSGIGLAFSKQIVELHHGSIEVASKKGKGTEFKLKLSMAPELYKDSMNAEHQKTDNIDAYNTLNKKSTTKSLNVESNKKPKLLIIDDNPDILNYLKDILAQDYNLTLANDGVDGLEKAISTMPDLIISDVMMPEKDGLTLCKELKEQITTSHIPVILLTARTSTVFEIEGLKTGADDYVTKPFNPTVIKARIKSLLENRAKLREHLLNKVRFEPTLTETEKNTDPESVFITKAITLVENNLQNPNFGVENMVEDFYMSQSTLYRKIKSLTGLSITAFIRSIRLKRAAHLILTEDMNLNQIAYEVGFNDYKYFKTSFKKQFKCLPSQYKEVFKDTH